MAPVSAWRNRSTGCTVRKIVLAELTPNPALYRTCRHAVPAPASLQALGMSWLTGGHCAALNVPSAVIPVERNFLLNPRHLEAQRVRLISDESFSFDTRLL